MNVRRASFFITLSVGLVVVHVEGPDVTFLMGWFLRVFAVSNDVERPVGLRLGGDAALRPHPGEGAGAACGYHRPLRPHYTISGRDGVRREGDVYRQVKREGEGAGLIEHLLEVWP